MAIEIRIDPIKADEFTKGTEKVALALDKLGDKYDEIRKKFAEGFGFKGGATGFAGKGGSDGVADTVTKASRAAAASIGPFERAARAAKELNDALASGDQNRIKDAEYKKMVADKAAAKAEIALGGGPTRQPADFNTILKSFLRTTRYGSGGVFPLIGRTLDLFGLGGSMAANAALFAAPMLMRMAGEGGRSFADISRGMAAAGGTAAQTGFAQGIGGAVGMDAGGMAGAAQQFGESLRGGGYGAAFFRSRGIVDFGYRTTNKMENLIKALSELSKISDKSQQMMVAQSAGLTQFLPLLQASPAARRFAMDSAARYAGDEQQIRAARDYEAVKSGWSSYFDSLSRKAFDKFGRPVTDWSMGWSNLLSGDIRGAANRGLHNANAYARLTWYPFGHWIDKKIDSLIPEGGANANANERHTEAINANTRALKEQREQLKGGAMAGGAVPSGWRFQSIEEALSLRAQALGYFQ